MCCPYNLGQFICLNGAGEELTLTLDQLLPHSFGPEHLSGQP